jgi:hypothetical protein
VRRARLLVTVSLTNTRVVSERVASFGWDQFTNLPSLDRIALAPDRTEGGGG